MPTERRAHPRAAVELSLTLGDGRRARTRNVSAQGIYFIVDTGAPLEPWLSIEYEPPESGLRFSAAGEVLRTEPVGDQLGIAIRLHSTRLAPTR